MTSSICPLPLSLSLRLLTPSSTTSVTIVMVTIVTVTMVTLRCVPGGRCNGDYRTCQDVGGALILWDHCVLPVSMVTTNGLNYN